MPLTDDTPSVHPTKPASEPAPATVLDKIIADALQQAREQAVEETMRKLFGPSGVYDGLSGLREAVLAECKRLIAEDPEVKQRMRDAVLTVLTRPVERRY